MTTHRLYPDSKLPMTEAEYERFCVARDENAKKNLCKSNRAELARRALQRAVRRMRGPVLSAEERTLSLFGGR